MDAWQSNDGAWGRSPQSGRPYSYANGRSRVNRRRGGRWGGCAGRGLLVWGGEVLVVEAGGGDDVDGFGVDGTQQRIDDAEVGGGVKQVAPYDAFDDGGNEWLAALHFLFIERHAFGFALRCECFHHVGVDVK